MQTEQVLNVSYDIVKGFAMTLQDALKLWPVIVVGASVIVTGTAAQFQISQNKQDNTKTAIQLAIEVEKIDARFEILRKDREMLIRLEEQNKSIRSDMSEIKKLLKELSK